jgi:hypothetical protein
MTTLVHGADVSSMMCIIILCIMAALQEKDKQRALTVLVAGINILAVTCMGRMQEITEKLIRN